MVTLSGGIQTDIYGNPITGAVDPYGNPATGAVDVFGNPSTAGTSGGGSGLQAIINQIAGINSGYGTTGAQGPSAWLPGVYSDVLTAYAGAPQVNYYNTYSSPSPTTLTGGATANTILPTPTATSGIDTTQTPITINNRTISPSLPAPLPFTPGPLPQFAKPELPTTQAIPASPYAPVPYTGGRPMPTGGGAQPAAPGQAPQPLGQQPGGGGLGQGMQPAGGGGGPLGSGAGGIPPGLLEILKGAIAAKGGGAMPNILPQSPVARYGTGNMLASGPARPQAPGGEGMRNAMPAGRATGGAPVGAAAATSNLVPPPPPLPPTAAQMQAQEPQIDNTIAAQAATNSAALNKALENQKIQLNGLVDEEFINSPRGQQLFKQWSDDDKTARNLDVRRGVPSTADLEANQARQHAWLHGSWWTPKAQAAFKTAFDGALEGRNTSERNVLDDAFNQGLTAAARTSRRLKNLVNGGPESYYQPVATFGGGLKGLGRAVLRTGAALASNRLGGRLPISAEAQAEIARYNKDVEQFEKLKEEGAKGAKEDVDRYLAAQDKSLTAQALQVRGNAVRSGAMFKQEAHDFEASKKGAITAINAKAANAIKQAAGVDTMLRHKSLLEARATSEDALDRHRKKMETIAEQHNHLIEAGQAIQQQRADIAERASDFLYGPEGEHYRKIKEEEAQSIGEYFKRKDVFSDPEAETPSAAPPSAAPPQAAPPSAAPQIKAAPPAGKAAQAPAKLPTGATPAMVAKAREVLGPQATPEQINRFLGNAMKIFGVPATLGKPLSKAAPSKALPGIALGVPPQAPIQWAAPPAGIPSPMEMQQDLATGLSGEERYFGKSGFQPLEEEAPPIFPPAPKVEFGPIGETAPYNPTSIQRGRAGGIDAVLNQAPPVNTDLEAYTKYLLNTPRSALEKQAKRRKK